MADCATQPACGDATVGLLLRSLEEARDQIRAIRAERWLAQWPKDHSERPKTPGYVVEYLRRAATSMEGG